MIPYQGVLYGGWGGYNYGEGCRNCFSCTGALGQLKQLWSLHPEAETKPENLHPKSRSFLNIHSCYFKSQLDL